MPAHEPASEPERRGQSLFLAAGCGACHAVRGTAANGTIGPDLTHLGGRRSVGIDTLPLTRREPRALHRATDQHVKPGNRMPDSAFSRPTSSPRSPPISLSLR